MKFWLKMVGAADWPLPNDWLTDDRGNRTDLLDRVRFPRNKRPSGISRGDRLVYYAAGGLRYFAIVSVTSPAPYSSEAEHRWPFVLDVRPLVLVPMLDVAPPVADLRLRKGNLSLRHQSHIELRPDQFEDAVAGIANVATSLRSS